MARENSVFFVHQVREILNSASKPVRSQEVLFLTCYKVNCECPFKNTDESIDFGSFVAVHGL